MPRPQLLSLRLLPKPDLTALDAVQLHQFKFVLATYAARPEEGVRLTDFFAVDDRGVHVYDLHLFDGDVGQVFLTGTKTRVGGVIRGQVDCGRNTQLTLELQTALDSYTPPPKPKAGAKRKGHG